MVVPKKEGKWRVCVDYTNLNMHAKRQFPFTMNRSNCGFHCGARMLSFLDAFSGYHKSSCTADEEKTVFIMPHGLYCYKSCHSDSKTLAHLSELMTKIFKPLVGRQSLPTLKEYDMKLNPSKCAFGVSAGKFLRFMVSQRGIEVSPDQVKAVIETHPKNKRNYSAHRQACCARSFIARFTDDYDPSSWQYEKLERAMDDSCQSAFEKIKHCLMQPPILSSPSLKKNCICIWLYRSGQLALFYSAAPAQGAETYLLTSVERWRT
ncbi:hypothetical protein CK203_059887 [Vitis vinifera]|uniref:Transposon Ty3-I Gag-Pol polyprotein n=1 Tax=Vitis vinifera TaxID=29760 RepID=A0A438GUE2_VITVI|nr:hypothetical protein CK203_059887 [Vitis vinifera]